jgi:large subunit ribosomal protein L24
MANKIKKGDEVVVITGKDKGKIGKVLQVLPKTNKILVSGVSIVKKTNKSQDDEQQSFSYNESHIDYSNVMYYDGSNSNGSKIGFKISSDGSKSRFLKKSGLLLS